MNSKIGELSSIIAQKTAQVDEYLSTHKQPSPSFEIDGPLDLHLPEEVEKARVVAIDASQELNDLLRGPVALVRPVVSLSPYTDKALLLMEFSSMAPVSKLFTDMTLPQRSQYME